ncbi:N-acetylmuramoyl-L-alanine amidase [Streptomyces sp. NPDC013489]|uniref:peptidoglycan recognition protein family protein n=1 Tax=Streptomyces sp. NPDC013489 TaxID=3155606 RepID=UPI0033C1C65C
MAWYPGATRMELQPESDQQHAIRPTQFIMHSIAAPWDEKRMYEYWRDSTNLESHFGLDYDGSIGQFIGTETRADANYRANERPDGTGAVSIETASNLKHTDAWTDEQVDQLIRLGVWLHQRHGIPLRICRTASDPGYGYHALHADWAVSGTACPGDARIRQFREVVFPGIVARATSTEEDDMTPEERKLLTDTAAAVKRIEAALAKKPWTYKGAGDPRDMHQVVKDIDKGVKGLAGASLAQTDALAKKLAEQLAGRLAN